MNLDKEREAFENWAKNNGYHVAKNPVSGIYLSLVCNDAWKAWQAAKASAVPDGYCVVPKEPTEEIINAMHDSFLGAFIEGKATGGQSIEFAYKAMIEAAQER